MLTIKFFFLFFLENTTSVDTSVCLWRAAYFKKLFLVSILRNIFFYIYPDLAATFDLHIFDSVTTTAYIRRILIKGSEIIKKVAYS